MSTTLYVKSNKEGNKVLPLVKSAIDAEITKLGLALEMASKRLSPFEIKHKTSSEYFINNMTAEDLDGNDDEYVNWAGEYKLKLKLEDKLRHLREIEYDKDVF